METFHLAGFGDLPASRRQAYSFYNMVPLEDGFPGRTTPAGPVPHPIYGTYLIRDFLTVAQKNRDAASLERAKRIADATLDRMETVGDALIFFYEENGLIGPSGRFYSGLTQARYTTPLADLAKASGDARYAKAAHAVFASLTVPASEGGVMRTVGDGAIIEEYPHEAPNFVLNGWTTAMLQVAEYSQTAGDTDARRFFDANMRALIRLLPLYDLPDLANSRYRLSGNLRHLITGPKPFAVTGKVRAGSESYEIHPAAEKGAWENTNRQERPNLVLLDTVLQRHVTPQENVLDLVIDSSEAQTLRYSPHLLSYIPTKGLRGAGWGEKREFPVVKGKQTLSIRVPWVDAQLVGEPTNFTKRVPEADGTIRHRNVYHYLHISNLWALYELTHDNRLLPWVAKWLRYTRRWPSMDLYSDPILDHRPVGTFRVGLDLVEALAGV